jgi:hypothetical protein
MEVASVGRIYHSLVSNAPSGRGRPRSGAWSTPGHRKKLWAPKGGTLTTYALTAGTCSNQFLLGTQQVAWLHFTTVSNRSSAFVNLNLDNTVGQHPDGTEVRNFAARSGQLVIIGEEPLLEAGFGENGQPVVNLYSKPGSGYMVETTAELNGLWTTNQTTTLTELWKALVVPGNASQQLYRAKR